MYQRLERLQLHLPEVQKSESPTAHLVLYSRFSALGWARSARTLSPRFHALAEEFFGATVPLGRFKRYGCDKEDVMKTLMMSQRSEQVQTRNIFNCQV